MNTISMKKISCVKAWPKIIGIMILVTILLAGGAGAATLKVDASGGADYTMIQEAINKASNGDTILVYSGTYYESINVNKKLLLRGIDNGGGSPVVDAIGSGGGSAITLSAGDSTLEGFKATNTRDTSAGIQISSNNNIVKNNIISNNNYGIILKSSSNNELSGNIANSNQGTGISLDSSTGNKLINNTAHSNVHYGIEMKSSNGNLLSGNKYSNNHWGIHLSYSSNNILKANEVINNQGRGISLDFSSGNNLNGNIVNSNLGGLNLYKSDSNMLSGNTINLNDGVGISFQASNNNEFSGNNATKNKERVIYMNAGGNNLLKDNTFNSNRNGIDLDSASKNNRVFHNNFISNGAQANGDSTNFWDSGQPGTGGNYWSDYKGIDSNNNGVGDTPYLIGNGGADRYPFMKINGWPKESTTPTAIATSNFNAFQNPTEEAQSGVNYPEKASGFEAILAISIIGALWLRRKL